MSLSSALFSPAQAKVLSWIFGQPARWYHVKELLRLTGLGSASLQRELKRLVDGGMVVTEQVGNLRRVRANQDSPVFDEMVSLVGKSVGLVPLVRQALVPIEGRIALALIFGSVAKQTDHAGSDIDLLVVSDSLGVGDLLPALLKVEAAVGRRVNPTVYSTAEFSRRRSQPGSFVSKILGQPTVILIGAIDGPDSAR